MSCACGLVAGDHVSHYLGHHRTVFWPMIRELYGSAIGRISHTDAELVRLVHRWIVWDWLRVSLIAIGFLASLRAISLPAMANGSNQAMQPTAGRSNV